jgi:hypothetical protein
VLPDCPPAAHLLLCVGKLCCCCQATLLLLLPWCWQGCAILLLDQRGWLLSNMQRTTPVDIVDSTTVDSISTCC